MFDKNVSTKVHKWKIEKESTNSALADSNINILSFFERVIKTFAMDKKEFHQMMFEYNPDLAAMDNEDIKREMREFVDAYKMKMAQVISELNVDEREILISAIVLCLTQAGDLSLAKKTYLKEIDFLQELDDEEGLDPCEMSIKLLEIKKIYKSLRSFNINNAMGYSMEILLFLQGMELLIPVMSIPDFSDFETGLPKKVSGVANLVGLLPLEVLTYAAKDIEYPSQRFPKEYIAQAMGQFHDAIIARDENELNYRIDPLAIAMMLNEYSNSPNSTKSVDELLREMIAPLFSVEENPHLEKIIDVVNFLNATDKYLLKKVTPPNWLSKNLVTSSQKDDEIHVEVNKGIIYKMSRLNNKMYTGGSGKSCLKTLEGLDFKYVNTSFELVKIMGGKNSQKIKDKESRLKFAFNGEFELLRKVLSKNSINVVYENGKNFIFKVKDENLSILVKNGLDLLLKESVIDFWGKERDLNVLIDDYLMRKDVGEKLLKPSSSITLKKF